MNGSIQHRPDRPRPWKARYRGFTGREHSMSFRRKVDAERWLRDEIGKLDRGVWVDPHGGTVRLAEWSEDWLRGLHVKPKTHAGYRELLDNLVLPTFGNAEVRRITPDKIRHWIADMAESGLSASRMRQATGVLRANLQQAVLDGRLGRNAADGAKVPKTVEREPRFLTADQLRALVQAVENRQHGAGLLVEVAGWSGLRWGEVVALRRRSVNVLARKLSISEAATEVNGKLIFGTTKTHETRTIILPREVAEKVGSRMASLQGDDLIFTAPKGGPLRRSNWSWRVWKPTLQDLEGLVPDDLWIHDLRDTAASLMVASGASILAVSRQLGHVNATVTLERYAHLYDDDLEALAVRLDDRYAEDAAAHTRPKSGPSVIGLS